MADRQFRLGRVFRGCRVRVRAGLLELMGEQNHYEQKVDLANLQGAMKGVDFEV